jgi:hypothetical protein
MVSPVMTTAACDDVSGHLDTTDTATLPARVDRQTGARLVTERFFPIGPRALERWPLQYRIVNRRALVETAELFAVAERMLKSAPFICRG